MSRFIAIPGKSRIIDADEYSSFSLRSCQITWATKGGGGGVFSYDTPEMAADAFDSLHSTLCRPRVVADK